MSYPPADPRHHAAALLQAGIAAADPVAAVKRHITDALAWFDSTPAANPHKIHLIAFGKAARSMLAAACAVIPAPHRAARPLAVTTADNALPLDDADVIGAGHPLPNEAGLLAARRVAEQIGAAGHSESILLLISGGGSALLPAPVNGVSLADKIATTRLLLACGADISRINCVRKHLSLLKGGGLARLAAPARLYALILSDVLGDDLSAIASGPTVADDSTYADAIAVLQSADIWQQVPDSVRRHLQQGVQGLHPETPKSGDPVFERSRHTLIGSNALSVTAALHAAERLGYRARAFGDPLCGEARDAAQRMLQQGKNLLAEDASQATALIAGGETTVTLRGSGSGGRNQELALAFALAAERDGLNSTWTFLSGGTDGRDGPTDAAGAVVNRHTLTRIRHAGIDPAAALAANDSYPALRAADALLMTGATGTNVADLQILLLTHSTTDDHSLGDAHV